MKAYKVVLLVVDSDNIGGGEIKSVIENQRYPNHCIGPRVMGMEGADIGEWRDEHPLNFAGSTPEEFKRLFPASDPKLTPCVVVMPSNIESFAVAVAAMPIGRSRLLRVEFPHPLCIDEHAAARGLEARTRPGCILRLPTEAVDRAYAASGGEGMAPFSSERAVVVVTRDMLEGL